ncbi:hypothetical protein [Cellulomonas endometrii]|uniref:hypothetical protein n=1 Tax=Cellulomonas endometrii TaxID=3036301 RepID=UPI0024ACAE52|nr:hypothetical protein [Cellulomonas endometrii]
MSAGTAAAEAAAVPVEVLTDEELAVLHGPESLVVQPHLATLPDADRALALRTAYRGLLARGIVDPPTAEALAAAVGEPTVELQVREDVLSLVALRRGAPAVVCVARTTVIGQDFWYAHVVRDVVLVEQVSADGLHRFALARADTLGDLLLDAAVHPGTADGSGPAIEVPDPSEPPLEITERLGSALLRADVVVRTVDDRQPPLSGLFTGPGGAWLLSAREGDRGPVTASPVSREDLEAHVRDLAAVAVDAAVPAGGAGR